MMSDYNFKNFKVYDNKCNYMYICLRNRPTTYKVKY